ncbi:unnamed protein product [Camellia sinensis]
MREVAIFAYFGKSPDNWSVSVGIVKVKCLQMIGLHLWCQPSWDCEAWTILTSVVKGVVMEDIERRNKNAHLKCFQVDLSSFQSILKFKGSFQQWLMDSDLHSSVQLLINNAGILATTFRLTAEGYEQMMGTNYIGAFSLIKVLLPLLENSPVPARIVNVTSFTHRSGRQGNCFWKVFFAHIYEYSKLCLLLFSYELHRHFGVIGKSHQMKMKIGKNNASQQEKNRERIVAESHLILESEFC